MAVQAFTSSNVEQLIKEGRRYEARVAAIDLLAKDKQNPQLLWMLVQVTDNADELIRILKTLVALPANPYTVLARARLDRLMANRSLNAKPYKPSPTERGSAKMIIGVALVIIFIGAAIITGSQVLKPAAQAPAQAVAVVVTRAARPTLPPVPTATPFVEPAVVSDPVILLPTETPMPEATTVSLASILPQNYDKYVKSVAQFDEDYNQAMAIIDNGKTLTFTMLDKISKYQANMRQARNTVMQISPINLPEDVRRDVVLPAQNAFITSANARLSLIDANLELRAMQETLAKSVSSGANAAQQTLNAKIKEIQQRQESVVSLRKTELDLAARYGAFVAYVDLQENRGQANAKFYYGVGASTKITLDAGTYRITTKAQSSEIVLRSPKDTKPQQLELVKIITLSEGIYTVETSGWWALAVEPSVTSDK